MAVQDFDLAEDFDLIIENGDFRVADSDQNHVLLIIKTFLGSFKQFPLVGMGIDQELASTGRQQVIKRNMRVQLNNDGYQVNNITLRDNATYDLNVERIRDING